MTQPETADLTPLHQDVVETVVDNWTRNSTALPLARLGQMLGARGHNLPMELAGRKLAEVIRGDLANSIRVIAHPNKALLLGAVPADAKIEGDLSTYFDRPPAAKDMPLGTKPQRFHRGVWIAFTREIAAGYVRTLALEPKPQFQDVSADAAEASGKHRIEPSDIVVGASLPVSSNVTAKVSQSIAAWAQRNGVAIENLYQRSHSGSFEAPPNGKLHGSLLERVLSVLSEDELKTVQIPLSIVKKLMKH